MKTVTVNKRSMRNKKRRTRWVSCCLKGF